MFLISLSEFCVFFYNSLTVTENTVADTLWATGQAALVIIKQPRQMYAFAPESHIEAVPAFM